MKMLETVKMLTILVLLAVSAVLMARGSAPGAGETAVITGAQS